jgi:hypothetical protein
MEMNGEQMDVIRSYAMELVDGILPYKAGDSKYQQVVGACGWQKGTGPGTTCGFLCHWMMWKLGVTNPEILNWNTAYSRFETARNVEKIWNKGQFPFRQIANPYAKPRQKNPIFNILELQHMNGGPSPGDIIGPRPGDIVMIKDLEKPNSEHVFVFCSAQTVTDPGGKRAGSALRAAIRKASGSFDTTMLQWTNGESGQENGTDAHMKTRDLILAGKTDGYTKITSGDPHDWAIKTVIGWLDLGQLDYDENVFRQILKQSVSA